MAIIQDNLVKNCRILFEQNFTAHMHFWQRLAHLDQGEDARVLLSGIIRIFSVPPNNINNSINIISLINVIQNMVLEAKSHIYKCKIIL